MLWFYKFLLCLIEFFSIFPWNIETTVLIFSINEANHRFLFLESSWITKCSFGFGFCFKTLHWKKWEKVQLGKFFLSFLKFFCQKCCLSFFIDVSNENCVHILLLYFLCFRYFWSILCATLSTKRIAVSCFLLKRCFFSSSLSHILPTW